MDTTTEIRVLSESEDQQNRLIQLIKLGLVDRTETSKLITAIKAADKDQNLTQDQKSGLLRLLSKLSNLVTSDPAIFNKSKSIAMGGKN